MSVLRPNKLHTRYQKGVFATGPRLPRRYTLTHSDLTGDLFLTIGKDYERKAISGLYTRLMRDEALAEWLDKPDGPSLHVYCHVSGGIALGSAGWRDQILHRHMPLVLQALRYGDRALYLAYPELEQAPAIVQFQALQPRYNRAENWGVMADYRITYEPKLASQEEDK